MKFIAATVALFTALLAGASAGAAELTQKDFELFAEARFGPPDGKPRYWYGKGPVRDPQTGKTIYIFEYYDTVRHIIDPKNPNKRYGIVRKLDLFRDKDTGALLETFEGRPVKPWVFPYQLLELEFKDGKMLLTVTQGAGEFVRTHKFPESNIERFGDFWHVTFPGHFKTRRAEIPDRYSTSTMTSLFIGCEANCGAYPRYQWNQSGVSTLAPWAGGDGTKLGYMAMSGARFEKYEELPKGVRETIEKHFPGFREPAKDLDEVRALQR
jgi:hypothetical protein